MKLFRSLRNCRITITFFVLILSIYSQYGFDNFLLCINYSEKLFLIISTMITLLFVCYIDRHLVE